MKHGKRPTAEQRKYIAAWGLNAENWLVCKDTNEKMVIEHRLSGQIRTLPGRGR